MYREININDLIFNLFIYILNQTRIQQRHVSLKLSSTKSSTDFKTFDIYGRTIYRKMSCLYTSEFLILWRFNATNIIRSKISHFKDFYRRFVKDGICARVYYLYFRVRIYNHLHSEMVYLIVGVLLWLLKPVRGQEKLRLPRTPRPIYKK